MAETIRVVEYYYATVGQKVGEARRLLEHLSERGVNLLAFTAFPLGADQAQLDFFPDNPDLLKQAAADAGVTLFGPKKAFMACGEDRVGALHEHHLRLANAGINIHASNGVCGGDGKYGYVMWVKPQDFQAAAKALGI
jgi:hypothetical protein